ncbi:MAG TPA: 50S ribosomal protein L21 [Rickettsiales bacterium]|nr:50S ribosomal protein L21 [Rickettsiales bacterium]
MFAVIRTGGKQYTVAPEDVILVEKLAGAAGDKVVIEEVLAIDGKIGAPLLNGAQVSAEIVEQTRGDKVLIFKKKRRHNYRRKNGHRQHLTALKITAIKA